jgi:glycerophosphoryl diester phosphodiesterase
MEFLCSTKNRGRLVTLQKFNQSSKLSEMKSNIIIRSVIILFIIAGGVGLYGFSRRQAMDTRHTIKVRNTQDLKKFFAYSQDRVPFISAHRGGPRKGFPENCIQTFENTLASTWAIMEIDPHYTKDSAIVLMHDATLERTSNGKGRVSDHTLEEVRKMKLKDLEGNLTNITVPTLDEVLEWAKGKTILVLDMKDVSIEARVKKIMEHRAEANAIVMAYSFEDAKKCYKMNPDILMEVMIPDMSKVREFDATGVPWKNVVVFVSHQLVKDPEIFEEIHKRGAMCMVGSSRNYDRSFTKGEIKSFDELAKNYIGMITPNGADIIEADLAIEVGNAIRTLQEKRGNSSKSGYFR